MNRRGFLKAVATVSATLMTPVAWAKRHYWKLHGDGVTDDTEALQAYMDGEMVIAPDGFPVRMKNGVVAMPYGVYRIKDTLTIK